MDYFVNYKNNIPLYQEFIDEVIYTIKEECKLAKYNFAGINGRVKTIDSIKKKIERHNIENPIDEIKDYAGVRIVCLFEEEKLLFAELIEKTFKAEGKDNKKEKLAANQMGYQSIHYYISFGAKFSGTRYHKYKNLICEVQITTVLLDAWALINHTLVYKNERSIPIEIQRDINNVCSLLEVAQKVFDDSYLKRKKYIAKIENSYSDTKDIFFSQPIDYDTLSFYTKILHPDLEISDMLQNKIIEVLDKEKYKTLKELNDAVIKAQPFVEHYKQQRPDLFRYGTDIITKSLGFVDKDFRMKHKFSSTTIKAFEDFEKKYAR